MNIDVVLNRLVKLEGDQTLQNLIAQANARYILLSTSESRENFPAYTINDENLALLAFYYLGIGCTLVEGNNIENARDPLERGASILEYIHGSGNNRIENSNYYGLVASLAYYACFQYSKSFILIKKFASNTKISRLVHLYLLRDYGTLTNELNEIFIDETYSDTTLAENEDSSDSDTKIYQITIAKSLDGYLKYFHTGDESFLLNAKLLLTSLKEIAEIQSDPGIWWVIRLLILVSEGFNESSLWNALGAHFDIKKTQVREYIQSLVFMHPRGIYELFITQRKSLVKVLEQDSKGTIVSIPTSSGKTRIAEIAILNCCSENPQHKVLYIAPFRSLAFELENSLDKVLDSAGITVSHLYGGNMYSKLDELVIEDSNVIIATPEKAKAMLRGNNDLMEQIKLIVIDEGHLLGANKRLIVNEMFYEELRFFTEKNNGRFLLLSAVLPNSEELAQWLTGSPEAVYKNKWRPSDERLGMLEWNGERVSLNWESKDEERPSFNNRFIVKEALPLSGRQRVIKYLPGNKNEAVAATAYKLRTFGPVLIFVGRKNSVFVMAAAYFKVLEDKVNDFPWPNAFDWRAFELSCIETYGEHNNDWLNYARKGILCHNADLHSDVRLPLERLMRGGKPRVIIATSTLGQGVNLGVSTVIFSTLYQSRDLISPRDFWNIAGRAGRAFIDNEGKILVAIDTAHGVPKRIHWERNLIRQYFDKEQIDLAKSGVLSLIILLKKIASENEVNFELLLQLIAENKTVDIGEEAERVDNTLDWIDDTLLSILYLNNPDEGEIDYGNVEAFFRKSLAFIQAENEDDISGEQVVSFIRSRMEGIVEKVGTDKNKWNSIVKSGIPLNSDLLIEEKMATLIETTRIFTASEKSIQDKIDLLVRIETIIENLPVLLEDGGTIKSTDIKEIRDKWINASPASEILPLENAINIITKLYTFKLPWIINGISKKLRNLELEDESDALDELSILVETGLPSLTKVKIYQAGIRSRTAANEIGTYFEDDLWNRTINDYKRDLTENRDFYKSLVSLTSGEWIDLLYRVMRRKDHSIRRIPEFTFGTVHENTNTLIAREIRGEQYLMSPDLTVIEKVSNNDKVDFSSINNISGITFEYTKRRGSWKMRNENPYVEII